VGQVIDIRALPVSLPAIDNGTVPPKRQTNAARRPREWLNAKEIEAILTAAGANRAGQRDACMILIAFRHALRVSELIDLRWSDVDFDTARMAVRRLKGSISGVHPIDGDEMRALRKLKRDGSGSEFVFISDRGAPFTAAGFRKLLTRAAARAGLGELNVHPHMLRHSTGYALANRAVDTRTLQAYMGHANIQNTVGYTALDASRFNGLWRQ
jgi:integrase